MGGCPWHLRDEFLTDGARRARAAAEEAMRKVIDDVKMAREGGSERPHSLSVVGAAIGRRVVCLGNAARSHLFARGVYQSDGTILEDKTRKCMNINSFCNHAGNLLKRPWHSIFLENQPEMTLAELRDMHGCVPPVVPPFDPQNDPHCATCGGGESATGNEILLCDGLNCGNSFHQQCMDPPALEVPEGAWLCPACCENGNIVDPEVRICVPPRLVCMHAFTSTHTWHVCGSVCTHTLTSMVSSGVRAGA